MDNRKYVSEFERRARHLPHWEEPGATYYVTFALRRPPPVDLTRPDIGRLIVGALRHFDGRRYVLYDYTVMPDHIHFILRPLGPPGESERLSRITQSLKGWLAYRINRLCARSGPLWQDESYDHILRNDADYQEKAGYILDNPSRRGLIADPTEWPWWGKGSGLV